MSNKIFVILDFGDVGVLSLEGAWNVVDRLVGRFTDRLITHHITYKGMQETGNGISIFSFISGHNSTPPSGSASDGCWPLVSQMLWPCL